MGEPLGIAVAFTAGLFGLTFAIGWTPCVGRGVLVFTNYYLLLNAWAISLTPDWLLVRR